MTHLVVSSFHQQILTCFWLSTQFQQIFSIAESFRRSISVMPAKNLVNQWDADTIHFGRSSPVGDAVEPLDDDDKQGKEISGTLCEGEGRGNGDGDDGVLGGLDGLLGLLVDGDEHSR
ncbi:unnamed protein product [Cuscuta campestris]|uniref:Uncharacterized protein n=1 Tax=Cuscuta campestris TaxID=132261 RepID=A0A484MX15_9ASTE|nr:unnamed protein product [Cuscuta campestris]